MTTNTEDLRAQFEKHCADSDYPEDALLMGDDCEYVYSNVVEMFDMFKAGHAAGVAAERQRCANLAADLSKYAARYRYLQSIAIQTGDSCGPIFRIDIRRIDKDGVWSNISATVDAHIASQQEHNDNM